MQKWAKEIGKTAKFGGFANIENLIIDIRGENRYNFAKLIGRMGNKRIFTLRWEVERGGAGYKEISGQVVRVFCWGA